MNYKDPENILLIICGSMGIAAFALVFRYLFIGLKFDDFGANLVFIIIFVIGLVVFISYLELIQKIAFRFFGKKQKVEEEQIESQPITNTEVDLNSLREQHQQEKSSQKEKLLETAIQYTKGTFALYASDENINIICQSVTDSANGLEVQPTKSIIVKDLSNGDLFHFGWNIWNHFRINKQEDIALFLKIVFARNLKNVEIDTVRKKLTFDEGKFHIKLEKAIFTKAK